MGWLSKILPRKTRFVGIDVGTAETKLAEVELAGGRPEVIRLSRLPSPPGVWGDVFDEEKLVEVLRELAPGVKEVISCLPGDKVVSRILRLPPMSDREREQAVRLEVERFLPTPVEELIIRSVWLEDKAGGEGRKCLILAVPAPLVYRFHELFRRAGLVLGVLDHPAFALHRLFRPQLREGGVALVDIGARVTQIVVARNGQIVFLRTLSAGGDLFTRSASEHYGVPFEEAERMKLEAAATIEDPSAAEAFRGGLLEVGREIKRSLEFCSTQEGVAVKRVILSGGGAKFRPLPVFLEGMLGLPVTVDTPSLRFSAPYDPAYAVALGLALREVVV
ncbi:type IV pilus assembly protein PilM [Ammonifex thiophilus]|uniref:Type IV pilus assembly protein PilM n=1 Tax=Ammonifex thiophilus TaxID=444093 RepID=A0A3D8P3B0_9THEO|nr:type IV pilus assembly protein PilM [Ammonifex thiophilus]RDV83219.1 type IV pilus assembly protein PilM [Ammonifex thiophilus]